MRRNWMKVTGCKFYDLMFYLFEARKAKKGKDIVDIYYV